MTWESFRRERLFASSSTVELWTRRVWREQQRRNPKNEGGGCSHGGAHFAQRGSGEGTNSATGEPTSCGQRHSSKTHASNGGPERDSLRAPARGHGGQPTTTCATVWPSGGADEAEAVALQKPRLFVETCLSALTPPRWQQFSQIHVEELDRTMRFRPRGSAEITFASSGTA